MTNLLTVCVIVFSPGTNGDWAEKYWHEMAHCNGWEHPSKASSFGEAFKPPSRYLFVYKGELIAYKVSTTKAMKLCNGHYGCQWFEQIKQED